VINFEFVSKAVEEWAYRLQLSYAPLNEENCNKIHINTFQQIFPGRSLEHAIGLLSMRHAKITAVWPQEGNEAIA
jgi:hypothetical protein